MTDSLEKILIVEDDSGSRQAMAEYLQSKGLFVITAVDGQQGLELLDSSVKAVITDFKMPRMDGMELLAEVRRRQPQTSVILLTAHGDVEMAVQAMKRGAADFLTKPVNPDELYIKIRKVHDAHVLARQNSELRMQLEEKHGFADIIGISPAVIEVFEQIERIAPRDCTVLISGENGTGKELVAKALHKRSSRSKGPFVAVSCAAIPGDLIESELFGHTKGAFTSAGSDQIGKFAAADGGTLFLDEVGELPLEMQAKFLRVLEDKTVTPVGSTVEKCLNVRTVFATNSDLREMMHAGTFREDLFYRVKVVNLHVPPLRDRRDDIKLIADHFLKELVNEDCTPPQISPDALQCLRRYGWPGNVRELRNVIETILVMGEKERIELEDLPKEIVDAKMQKQVSSVPAGLSLKELEREAIENTLRKVGGSRVKAAETLGLSVRSIQRKISEYGLEI